MGRLVYGRRRSEKSKRTETIEAAVEALVPPELWQAAQQTMSDNRIAPRNTERVYLLRGVMKCARCGLSYCGAQGEKGVAWYRCNGYMAERGGKEHRCQGKAVRNDKIEPAVWQDIETMLREPGSLLDVLQAEAKEAPDEGAAEAEAQIAVLTLALEELEPRRKAVLDMFERRRISPEELDERLDRIDTERKELNARIAAVCVPERQEPPLDDDLLELLRQRLDEGLSDEQRSEIVRLLVRQITVNTTIDEEGTKALSFVIEYRFRQPDCSPDCNGRGSSPPAA
jgi:site-specific DNA recombinase